LQRKCGDLLDIVRFLHFEIVEQKLIIF